MQPADVQVLEIVKPVGERYDLVVMLVAFAQQQRLALHHPQEKGAFHLHQLEHSPAQVTAV